tara:strand:+ start:71 stop:379 length:309 start_codon:yes stop_codon:yes gene_type:complete
MNFTTRNPSFINKKPTSISAGDSAGIRMWIKQRQKEGSPSNLVWGRIRDTGINYIVEGHPCDGTAFLLDQWVQIPCRRLLDARLLLGGIMNRLDFDLAKSGQ